MKYSTHSFLPELGFLIFTISIGLFLSGCGQISQAAGKTPSSSGTGASFASAGGSSGEKRPFFDSQSTIFHSLNVTEGDPVTAELDVYLNGPEAEFLFIEAVEDCDVKISYTYTTDASDGVSFGCYHEADGRSDADELTAATEKAYEGFWTDEIVSLKKGMNVFFLSGTDKSCRMYLELSAEKPELLSYAGASPTVSAEEPETK